MDDVREYYDTIADLYVSMFAGYLEQRPLDRAVLAAFAEMVLAAPGPVVEVGSGPGWITAHLAGLGLEISGLDLSPRMVSKAREAYPDLRFDQGSMTGLPYWDGALRGVAAWYSMIHLAPEARPEAFAEFHRVLTPDGLLLVAFQVGDYVNEVAPEGYDVSLGFRRLQPAVIQNELTAAGFAVLATSVRAPLLPGERDDQAFIIARR